jgi:hypothetical protein
VSEYYYNGKIVTVQDLMNAFNFHPKDGVPESQWMIDNDVKEVEGYPTIDQDTQVIEPSAGSEVNGRWRAFNVRSKTNDEKWVMLRGKRDELLKDSDFTQLGDSPSNAVTWQVYRKLLRDLPTNYPNADDVIWPTPPVVE